MSIINTALIGKLKKTKADKSYVDELVIPQYEKGNSVYVGTNAGLNDDETDNSNVGLGNGSLENNTTGSSNTASGRNSLHSNTTGSSNTSNGRNALYTNTTGSYNTANGANALYYNTTGHNNIANGAFALSSNTTGHNNIANGSYALSSNTSGSYNISIGRNALYFNTTGSYNTSNGTDAGMYTSTDVNNETGTNNTFIGYDTRPLADGDTNETVIGNGAVGNGSNTVTIGNDDIINTYLQGVINGDGSGLTSVDADTVDGIQAASFLRSDADDTINSFLTIASGKYIKGSDDNPLIQVNGGDAYIGSTGRVTTVLASSSNLVHNRAGTEYAIWTAYNDGSGSGLDADLLDGQHASSFAPASHNHTSLTGVTSISFAAEASDAMSISRTINGNGTYFDFNLTDDNNNDWWRWRFTPSGSTVYDAMTLKPVSNGNANLTVSGTVTADSFDGESLTLTNSSIQDSTTTTSSTSVTSIASFTSSTFKSGKFLIQISDGTDIQITELLVAHNGTIANSTEFGVVYTDTLLAGFEAVVNGANVEIRATATTSSLLTYKVSKQMIKA